MPLLDKFVEKLPLWVSPNALTFSTLLVSFILYLLTAYYDWEFLASSEDYFEYEPIPNWVWIVSSFCIAVGLVLDAMDGKLARRLNNCSPVGELLDHGIDSWRLGVPLLALHFSLFGRGDYGIPPQRQMCLLIFCQFIVIGSFVVQNLTGTFYYTFSSDTAHYVSMWWFFHTWYRNGASWWQCDALAFGTNANVVEGFIYIGVILVSAVQLCGFLRRSITFVPGV